MPKATPLAPPSPATTAPRVETEQAETQELLSAMRSLFTCTRKVRSWVSNAGALTVLDAVAEQGEAKVSAISAALLLDVSTVSRALSALCRDGLVQWRTDATDGRSHLVSCTPAGQDRLNERRQQVTLELDRRLADWPLGDIAQLSNLLNRFVASLGADPGETPADLTSPSTAKESA